MSTMYTLIKAYRLSAMRQLVLALLIAALSSQEDALRDRLLRTISNDVNMESVTNALIAFAPVATKSDEQILLECLKTRDLFNEGEMNPANANYTLCARLSGLSYAVDLYNALLADEKFTTSLNRVTDLLIGIRSLPNESSVIFLNRIIQIGKRGRRFSDEAIGTLLWINTDASVRGAFDVLLGHKEERDLDELVRMYFGPRRDSPHIINGFCAIVRNGGQQSLVLGNILAIYYDIWNKGWDRNFAHISRAVGRDKFTVEANIQLIKLDKVLLEAVVHPATKDLISSRLDADRERLENQLSQRLSEQLGLQQWGVRVTIDHPGE